MTTTEMGLVGAKNNDATGIETDHRMQIISILIILGTAVPLILFPEQGKTLLDGLFKWMTSSFDFAFLGIGLAGGITFW